ncbi:MAG: hypothetical protein K6A96_07960 [Prevotella sp.]|nr:hypothetical protein [Prevotella sp.]
MSRKAIYIILLCLLPMLSSAQTLTRLEYWFDDGFNQKRAINLSGTEYEVDTEINTTGLDVGLHKLWYRVRRSDGMYSPVSCSLFYKNLIAGEQTLTRLEYWFDDNFNSKRAFNLSGSEFVVNDSINMQSLDDGLHKLWYRVRRSDGKYSPISSSLVLKPMKSLYNIENPEALTVTEQAYWFDDEEPEVITISNPKHEIVQPTTFDTRRLSDGKHTLHMRFGNSAGIWNGPVDAEFTKAKVVDPEITATASVEEGVVKLAFNAVPNGQTYTIVRKYPSGNIRKVEDIPNGQYPADLQSSDTPAPGTYTYYVEGHYRDINDQPQKVRSNEVSVTVEQAASLLGKGKINAVLTINGERDMGFNNYTVTVNGESIGNTDYHCENMYRGNFYISNIPFGTEVTIGIQRNDYTFEEKTIVVNENTKDRTYYFDGTKDDGILPDNSISDLAMYNQIYLTDSGWEINLKNKSSAPWSGDIIFKIVSKKAKDGYDNRDNEDDWSFMDLFTPKASYEDVPHYTEAAHSHVSLNGKENKVFTLSISDLPETDKNEDYYVYVYSKKDGTGLPKVLDGDFPQVVKFNPFDYAAALERGFVAYMKDYAEVMKWMKKFSAWGDPLKLAWSSTGQAFDNYIAGLEHGDETLGELNDEVADAAIRSAGLLLNCFFEDMHKAVKKHVKSIKSTDAYIVCDAISRLYNKINSVYNAYNADDNHKFFELAKLLFKYSKDLGIDTDPVVSIYKTYFEVGEKMASNIENLSNTVTNYLVWDKLAGGNGIYKIKIRRYPINGKHTGYFPGTDFYKDKNSIHHHNGEITNIEILLRNPINGVENPSKPIGNDNIEITDDGITIKNVKFMNKPDSQTSTEAWMTITWKNKRVTHIPLLDDDFVKIQNLNSYSDTDPIIMTVELQSESYINLDNLANKLTFVKP